MTAPEASYVVQSTVRMTKAEHQRRLCTVAGDADDDAVGRALALHLHPFALPWQILTVATLGDHPLETGHKAQPFLSLQDGSGLSNELEARAGLFEQGFEATSPMALLLIDEIGARVPHEVKCKQYRR